MPPSGNAHNGRSGHNHCYGHYHSFFKPNDRVRADVPQWVKRRETLKSCFPTYESTSIDTFPDEVRTAMDSITSLKHPKANCPVYYGDASPIVDYSDVTKAAVPLAGDTIQQVVEDMADLLIGLPNSAHPLHQANVLPNPNKASIIAALIANYTSQNAIEGEYAWNLCKAEMETAAMVAKLIPKWCETEAGGIFTYGGSGCYLYAVKYALSHVIKDSRCKGIPDVNAKLICSQQGHYAKMNSTDWLGVGMENIHEINCDDDSNEMELSHLYDVLQECKSKGEPVAAIICTMGTTDAFAVDDVKAVREYLHKNQINDPSKYNQPLIYCDAVIGWSFLLFSGYNFHANPLQFSEPVCRKIEQTYHKIKNIGYADAVGIDFHKTGWVQYATSMFMMKDFRQYRDLMSRPGSAYLHDRTPYNPGLYSLEVSRSAAPALSAWATLKYLGLEGFQTIIGGILEMSQYLRHIIKKEENMVCVNEEDYGFVTLFRMYQSLKGPDGEDLTADEMYEKELSIGSHSHKSEVEWLKANNNYQQKIADGMWSWLHADTPPQDGWTPPFVTYTSGFRTTDPVDDLGSEYVIYALKSYPMNVSVTTNHMHSLLAHFKECARKVDNDELPTIPNDLICAPYTGKWSVPDCDGNHDGPKITSLLSGVPGKVKGRGKAKGRKEGKGAAVGRNK